MILYLDINLYSESQDFLSFLYKIRMNYFIRFNIGTADINSCLIQVYRTEKEIGE